MTVHFIGAGPGAPDLITLRGLNYIKVSQVCLYAGSLVPKEVVAEAPINAEVIDTASMHLDQIIEEIISTIVGKVEADTMSTINKKKPENMDAYELVLKGLDYARKGGVIKKYTENAPVFSQQEIVFVYLCNARRNY